MTGESAQARIRETARNRGGKGMSGSNHNYIWTYPAARGILGRAVFFVGTLGQGRARPGSPYSQDFRRITANSMRLLCGFLTIRMKDSSCYAV